MLDAVPTDSGRVARTDHKLTRKTLAEPGGKNCSPYSRKSFPSPPGKISFSRRETLSRRAAAITKVSGPDFMASRVRARDFEQEGAEVTEGLSYEVRLLSAISVTSS